MKIGIIGYGVVCKAAAHTLSKKYKIVKFDKYVDYDKFEDLKRCDFVFITVPTPFDCDKNEVDESAIIESLNKLEKIGYENVVIIKSTVPPGTCMRYSEKYNLNIAFNPEFLRESTTPNKDFENQDTIVIGTDNSKTLASNPIRTTSGSAKFRVFHKNHGVDPPNKICGWNCSRLLK